MTAELDSGRRVGSRWSRLSLAARLVLLFSVGTSALLFILGTGLTLTLRSQLEARDREEIDGKTEVVLHLLRELETSDRITAGVARFSDIVIGHPHLQIGLREGERWWVRPSPEILTQVGPAGNDDIPHTPRLGSFRLGHDIWWLRRIDFVSSDQRVFSAYVGVHVSPAQVLMERLIGSMLLAGVVGVAASAALGWLIARRGLAPIRAAAREAERVTAQRLSEPLNAADAPEEVRGLLTSINLMLSRLQDSFRTLEEFSADIAHELRTPLNNLMLQTQVTLSRERSATEYQDALHSNLHELEQLQRMVSDMLFLARADRGMVQIQREAVELAKEVRAVADYFEPASSEHGQVIEIHGIATAACDRAMVRRALTNLLSNAVRYAPRNAHIRVDITAQPSGGAIVDVSNPAPPMSAEELQRLFGRFARGPQAPASGTARAPEGAGLGLSIVDSIMRLHGGALTADSTAIGVRFRLSFPPP
jgi:two-component system heavy metal sensor histidine kinase CusS